MSGQLAGPEAPRGLVDSGREMFGVSGQVPFRQIGSAAGKPGRKHEKVVSCRSLLHLLTESRSTCGKCSECFLLSMPEFLWLPQALVVEEEGGMVSPPPSFCGVTAQR